MTPHDLTPLSSLFNPLKRNAWIHNSDSCSKLAIMRLRMVREWRGARNKRGCSANDVLAGIPMDKAMGTKTSVHVGCLLQEYSQISQRDTDLPGNYQIVGSSGLSMLANRLSWFYDFKGPSMTVDTACSGSLLALHLGCQDLLSGTVDMVSLVI